MKKIIILLIVLNTVGLLFSQTIEIDLEKAIALVKSNNIDIKRATLTLDGKRKNKDSAYNVFYPTVSGTGTLSKLNTQPESEYISEDNLSLGYEASFNFTPALFNAVTLLIKDYELGQVSYSKTVAQIEMSIKEIFYNIILLREQISLLEDNLKTMESRYNLTKLNNQAGLASELDVLQVQVSFENFKPELNNLKNVYNTTLMNFKNMLGIDLKSDIVIKGEINPVVNELTVDEAFNLALSNNQDLQMILTGEEFLVAQKKARFAQYFLPIFNFTYSSGTILNDPFSEDGIELDNFTSDSGMFSFSVIYSFTGLLPGSEERMELEDIKRNLQDNILQQESLLNGLRLQITNHIEALNNSMTIQKGLELTEILAKKTLDKVEIAYKTGIADLLEVENVQNEYKKARIELLKEKISYTNSLLKLEAIISPQ